MLDTEQSSKPLTTLDGTIGYSKAAIFATISVVFIAFWIGVSVLVARRVERPFYNRSTFCCSSLFEDMLLSANKNVDSCLDFWSFVCYDYDENNGLVIHNLTAERDASLHFVLQGRSNTSTGKSIFRYYESCLMAMEPGAPLERMSVRAVISTVGGSHSMAAGDVMRLMIRLALGYNINFGIQFTITGNIDPHLDITIGSRQLRYLPSMRDHYLTFRRKALLEVNTLLSFNVVTKDLESLVEELDSLDPAPHRTYNISDLEILVDGLSIGWWKAVLEECSYQPLPTKMRARPLGELRYLLGRLLKRENISTTAAFVIVEGAAALSMNTFNEKQREEKRFFEYCEEQARVWDYIRFVNTVQEQRLNVLDSELRTMFSAIVDEVMRAAKDTFDSSDVRKLEDTLGTFKLILPSDLIPNSYSVPTLSANFIRNHLLYLEYNFVFRKHMRALGILGCNFDVQTDPSVLPCGNYLLIPTTLYSSLKRTNHEEPITAMAIVGIRMADSVWSRIFQESWNNNTKNTLDEHHYCVPLTLALSDAKFERPWLSLWSSAQAVKHKAWYHKTVKWNTWELSLSQIFYMLVFFFNYCSAKTLRLYKDEMKSSLSSFQDFVTSFGCEVSYISENMSCRALWMKRSPH